MDYNKFVFDEIRRIGKAFTDQNPGYGTNDIELLFEKIGEQSWRRLVDKKSMHQIFSEMGVDPIKYGELIPEIIEPVKQGELIKYPRYGLSVAGLVMNRKHDIKATVEKLLEAGANATRINIFGAVRGEDSVQPFNKHPDGLWDLYDWNHEYYERLMETKERMNNAGIVCTWTFLDLYSWSDRKPGPQQDNTPWRHNKNGVYWKPDDKTFQVLPDNWCKEFIARTAPQLRLDTNIWEIGNEMPEKSMHEEMRDLVRRTVPSALIQVNRNDDTPGQYDNMKIGKNYDFLALHGRKLKRLGDLVEKYKGGDYPTFKDFMASKHEPWRVVFSSDGARISDDKVDTYDWDRLREWFRFVKKEGYNIEHQSRAKMTPAPNHHMIEVDWFRSVIA